VKSRKIRVSVSCGPDARSHILFDSLWRTLMSAPSTPTKPRPPRPLEIPPRTLAATTSGSDELALDLNRLEQAERVERDRRREEELRRAQELARFD
jgi:hypothetical protein